MAAKALTSKSLKTNNLGGFMEVKPERIAEIIRKIDPNNNMAASELADAIMQELEKDRKLSDLEIVQKALAKTGSTLHLYSDGSSQTVGGYFENSESLLTWAKQTIGVER